MLRQYRGQYLANESIRKGDNMRVTLRKKGDGMKAILILAGLTVAGESFAFESIHEFWEKYRSKSCEQSQAKAAARILEQAKSHSDIYDGPIAHFKGKRILRFVQSVQHCEVLWSEDQGRLYDYMLRVEVTD